MIRQKIQDDQITALKRGEKKKLETIRYLLAQIKNKEIEKKEDLNDEETVNIIRKQTRELSESIESFKKGARKDLADEYQNQLEIISAYLPLEIDDDELENEIRNIVEKNRELYMKNSKLVIGICVKELKSRVNPQRITKMLNEKQF